MKLILKKDKGGNRHYICLSFCFAWPEAKEGTVGLGSIVFEIGDWGTCCTLISGVEDSQVKNGEEDWGLGWKCDPPFLHAFAQFLVQIYGTCTSQDIICRGYLSLHF